jgi:hypothetical protein
VKRTLAPVFEQCFVFDVGDCRLEALQLNAQSWSRLGKAVALGDLRIPLRQVS